MNNQRGLFGCFVTIMVVTFLAIAAWYATLGTIAIHFLKKFW